MRLHPTFARRVTLLARAVFVLAVMGCSDNPQPVAPTAASSAELPDSWSELNLSHGATEAGDNIILRARKQPFASIVEAIRPKLSKSIKLSNDIDVTKTLDEFEIELPSGTWVTLLGKVAEQYGYYLDENDTEFVIRMPNVNQSGP